MFDPDLDTEQVYTIDPILPTPATARGMDDEGGSPFLFTYSILGERFSEYSMRVSVYYEFLNNKWNRLRRLTRFFLDSNWELFDPLMQELINEELDDINPLIRYDVLYRLYDQFLTPLCVYPLHINMRREWNEFFLPRGANADAISSFQEVLVTDPDFLICRESLFDCISQYINVGDAVLPGVILDLYPQDHSQYGDLRIYRDNFPELRDLYIQCFEACTQSFTFIIEAVNVVNRGDPSAYATFPEIHRTPNNRNQFNRLTAEKKLFYFRELTVWDGCLTSTMDRQLRNKIGHRGINHHLPSGEIRVDGQPPTPYIEFVRSVERICYPLISCLNALKIAEIHHIIRSRDDST
ncbi:MAG: hypothetical protein ABIA75_14090 [Candidatus Neomarinimicrobiota bacterium]